MPMNWSSIDQRLLSDPIVLGGLAAAAAALLLLALVLLLRRPRLERFTAPLTQAVGELQGRLAQMADSQAATQAALAERMQAQERVLARHLEERLAGLGKTGGDPPQEQNGQASQALAGPRARPAPIRAPR